MEMDLRQLIDLLNEYTKLYDAGTPAISDKEWDDLYFQLVEREKRDGIIYPDSPTQTIHFDEVSKLDKIIHSHPMLSLAKTKDISEVESFTSKSDCIFMLKMDGLTASIRYENGKLVSAETRGNGVVGEDITHNIIHVNTVPITIPYTGTLVVDGEIICDTETFEKNFSKEFANPRNYAAGAIRRLNSKENQNSGLSFIAWDCIEGSDKETLSKKLCFLYEQGFEIVPFIGMPKEEDETIENGFECLQELAKRHGYPIDGIVIKYNDCEYYQSLGNTEHHFRGGLAYKFYDEEYETKLLDISYDVSRLGILTPVAVFEPLDVDGSVIERASLHNMTIMREILGDTPYYGEPIWVYKANMIIPQISRAEKRDYGDIIAAGGVTVGLGGDHGIICPICGGLTSIIKSDSGVEVLYCDNEECPGKLAQKIDHFCGKKGLDIKGISRKTIEKLIEWGWINGLADIFRLNEHKAEWVSKAGFGEASVGKILSAIDAARTGTSGQAFISALGIPLVGSTVSKEIVKYYSTWKDFRDAVGGDWTAFDGFGPEMSKAINSFDYTEADEIAEMLDFKSAEVNEVAQSEGVKDKTFVITGKLSKKRDDIKAEIEHRGGKVTGSVSSKTTYLVCNDKNSTTGKSADAKKFGVPVITEEELYGLF